MRVREAREHRGLRKNLLSHVNNYFKISITSGIFISDPHSTVSDPKCIENLQEQSHRAFKRYIDTTYPSQPERFARILLKLPSIRAIDRHVVEELFFEPLIGTVRIAEIMNNIVSQTQEF